MTSSSFFSSSILNIPTSKTPVVILYLDTPFAKFKIPPKRCELFVVKSSSDSTTVVEENNSPAETSSNSAYSGNSFIDEEDEKAAEAQGKIGARVRVNVPLKVYHVPKVPEVELKGRIGVLKQYVAVHKGKRISANLPYKVEFVADNLEGRDGTVKFFAHLKEDEFEYLD